MSKVITEFKKNVKELNGLYELLKQWIDDKKTGNIQINFFRGGISNINKTESVKLDK